MALSPRERAGLTQALQDNPDLFEDPTIRNAVLRRTGGIPLDPRLSNAPLEDVVDRPRTQVFFPEQSAEVAGRTARRMPNANVYVGSEQDLFGHMEHGEVFSGYREDAGLPEGARPARDVQTQIVNPLTGAPTRVPRATAQDVRDVGRQPSVEERVAEIQARAAAAYRMAEAEYQRERTQRNASSMASRRVLSAGGTRQQADIMERIGADPSAPISVADYDDVVDLAGIDAPVRGARPSKQSPKGKTAQAARDALVTLNKEIKEADQAARAALANVSVSTTAEYEAAVQKVAQGAGRVGGIVEQGLIRNPPEAVKKQLAKSADEQHKLEIAAADKDRQYDVEARAEIRAESATPEIAAAKMADIDAAQAGNPVYEDYQRKMDEKRARVSSKTQRNTSASNERAAKGELDPTDALDVAVAKATGGLNEGRHAAWLEYADKGATPMGKGVGVVKPLEVQDDTVVTGILADIDAGVGHEQAITDAMEALDKAGSATGLDDKGSAHVRSMLEVAVRDRIKKQANTATQQAKQDEHRQEKEQIDGRVDSVRKRIFGDNASVNFAAEVERMGKNTAAAQWHGYGTPEQHARRMLLERMDDMFTGQAAVDLDTAIAGWSTDAQSEDPRYENVNTLLGDMRNALDDRRKADSFKNLLADKERDAKVQANADEGLLTAFYKDPETGKELEATFRRDDPYEADLHERFKSAGSVEQGQILDEAEDHRKTVRVSAKRRDELIANLDDGFGWERATWAEGGTALEDRPLPGFRSTESLEEMDPFDREAVLLGMQESVGQVWGLQTGLTRQDSLEIQKRIAKMRADNKPKMQEELEKEREAIETMYQETSAQHKGEPTEQAKAAAERIAADEARTKDVNDWVKRNKDNLTDPNLGKVVARMLEMGLLDDKNTVWLSGILSKKENQNNPVFRAIHGEGQVTEKSIQAALAKGKSDVELEDK